MVTIETPQKTLEVEISLLDSMREGDDLDGVNAFILGAMCALSWIARGEKQPSAYSLHMKTKSGTVQ